MYTFLFKCCINIINRVFYVQPLSMDVQFYIDICIALVLKFLCKPKGAET